MLKNDKDFKIPLKTLFEEWVVFLDLADNYYLKYIVIPYF